MAKPSSSNLSLEAIGTMVRVDVLAPDPEVDLENVPEVVRARPSVPDQNHEADHDQHQKVINGRSQRAARNQKVVRELQKRSDHATNGDHEVDHVKSAVVDPDLARDSQLTSVLGAASLDILQPLLGFVEQNIIEEGNLKYTVFQFSSLTRILPFFITFI